VTLLSEDRLFPPDAATRAIARRLYDGVKDLPIVSPHGHTDPRWFAEDEPFADPATLFIIPDHYIFRMLYSQGISLEELDIRPKSGHPQRSIRVPRGGSSRRTTPSSVAHRPASGSTTSSRPCSE
jgi:glucuronate isomerase